MKNILSILLALFLVASSFAQMPEEGTPEFEKLYTTSAEEDSLCKKEGMFGLSFSMKRDYKYNEEGKLELLHSLHRAYKLHDEARIKNHKKFSFSEDVLESILACEGRLIRDGKVLKKLTKSDLVPVENSEDYEEEDEETASDEKTKYQGLLFEEAQPGDIIEFYFLRKMPNISESGRYALQDDYAIKNVTFQLSMPSNLKPDVRVYNADEVAADFVDEKEGVRYTTVHIPYIKGVKVETMSFRYANLVCVDYVLAYNYAVRKQRFNTISEYGRNIYSMNSTMTKADQKAYKKIKSGIKITKSMQEEEKIRTMESHIKDKYGYVNLYIGNLSSIEGINQYGMGNSLAFIRLYYQLFNEFGIVHEIVSTADRTRINFDPDFDAKNNLDEFIFYFPRIDKYMSPDDFSLRLGFIPEELMGQYAAYYEPTTMGSITTYLHSIKQIPVLGKELTGDTLKLTLSIEPEREIVSAHVYRAITGYNTTVFQAKYNDLTADGREFMLNHYLALDDDNNIVKNETYRNYAPEDVGVKPFVLEGDFTSAALTTQAPNGFDLNVGKLIGEQSEFKQEGERHFPIQTMNNKHYYRLLTIRIPDGYICTNLEDFNYEIYDRNDKNKATAAFTVEAKQQGKEIIITCMEYYDSIYYPAYEHAGYGRVINAAFDFNKKKMSFEKKG